MWEDGEARRVVLLDDDDGGGPFQVRLPFAVIRRFVDARQQQQLPDLAALELRCVYCLRRDVGPAAPACAHCHGQKLWRLPWRGHVSSDSDALQVRACMSISDVSSSHLFLRIRSSR